jgi:hypothetical protein
MDPSQKVSIVIDANVLIKQIRLRDLLQPATSLSQETQETMND